MSAHQLTRKRRIMGDNDHGSFNASGISPPSMLYAYVYRYHNECRVQWTISREAFVPQPPMPLMWIHLGQVDTHEGVTAALSSKCPPTMTPNPTRDREPQPGHQKKPTVNGNNTRIMNIASTPSTAHQPRGFSKLNDDQPLIHIKLSVAQQGDYVHGQKGLFRKHISALQWQDDQIRLTDPRSTIQDLVTAREVQLQPWGDGRKSGNVQEETELTQNTSEELERKKLEAAEARRNMTVPSCDKRLAGDSEEPIAFGNSQSPSSKEEEKSYGTAVYFSRGLVNAIANGSSMYDSTKRELDDLKESVGKLFEEEREAQEIKRQKEWEERARKQAEDKIERAKDQEAMRTMQQAIRGKPSNMDPTSK
ncbi:hypothetical protein BZA77DRAFT_361328 [Pyronema omphalodes]|nr:hypothetical protein BZA77DRAFT_361328 [Pyronema omphalodes]